MSSTSLSLTAVLLLVTSMPSLVAAEYDPLRTIAGAGSKTLELTVHDAPRDRQIPLLVYLPVESPRTDGAPQAEPSDSATRAAPTPAPVVLFSHGLGGAREGSAYLGRHWAARGYVAVFLQHPGSDEGVWRDLPPRERMAAMQEAASMRNLLLRAQDVPAVLDQLQKWNDEAGHALAGRLDLKRVGMSGHSFGAMTTQAVSGQAAGRLGPRLTDSRIRAAIAMSPSSPQRFDAQAAFGGVKIPWLLMTGTRDTAPIGGQTVESRRAVFPALPPGDKFELVLHEAEHSAFTERALPGDRQPRNPKHHPSILAISTAFWDAYLRDDAAAKAWLAGDGARSVLQPRDEWQTK